MGRALYRTYRSRNLDEIVGQEHITTTLKNAIKAGKISHAYLFTGPRGVGKTSIARILAHEVNGLDYSDDDQVHLDIIEIDAASNRRIDEIRDLREKVHIAPTSAQYKVYIIDEVHMLTKEAFNALLKTLEEPPAHCIFILATTEVHKLPETIISRTQRFSFKPVEKAAVVTHLKEIAKKESIQVSDKALEAIAEHGGGSFRDSISLLDQLGSRGTKIEIEDTLQSLGIPPQQVVDGLLSAISNHDPSEVLSIIQSARDQGFGPVAIAKKMSETIRAELLDNNVLHAALLKSLLDVSPSHEPQQLLEIILLEAAVAQTMSAPSSKPTLTKSKMHIDPQDPPSPPKKNTKKPDEHETPVSPSQDAAAKPQEDIETSAPDAAQLADSTIVSSSEDQGQMSPLPNAHSQEGGSLDLERWDEILRETKTRAASLYSALRLAEPRLNGSTLTLAFPFALHQKKIEQPKAKQILGEILSLFGGHGIKIEAIVEKNVQPPVASNFSNEPPPPISPEGDQTIENNVASQPSEALQTISNIFGGAEVLES